MQTLLTQDDLSKRVGDRPAKTLTDTWTLGCCVPARFALTVQYNLCAAVVVLLSLDNGSMYVSAFFVDTFSAEPCLSLPLQPCRQ